MDVVKRFLGAIATAVLAVILGLLVGALVNWTAGVVVFALLLLLALCLVFVAFRKLLTHGREVKHGIEAYLEEERRSGPDLSHPRQPRRTDDHLW